ncbi:MAG: alanine racemase [Bdellovibrionota bacterium]|nr:alanine racemase [Pseudobdellovibrionaceae bacterium]|tara:strand:- start:2261 stop:3403 length:1143 start_codon:yes stop_codon:yes gene_type:complete
MHRRTTATINLSNLRSNLREIKKHSHSEKVCFMIKANAYGHGLVEVAKACEEVVDSFGIISLEEAAELRVSGVKAPLWLFSNLWKESIADLEKLSVTPVIGDFSSLDHFLSNSSSDKKFHLKFNTGMNRFGFRLNQKDLLLQKLEGFEGRVEGLATHMLDGNAYRDEKGACSRQLHEFKEFLRAFPKLANKQLHIYKSAPALLNDPPIHTDEYFQWIRPGIASYGCRPETSFPVTCNLKPVMQLESCLLSFQEIKAGESVSYSSTWTAERDSLIGVVQIGYADGLKRCLSNKVSFLVAGQRVPQVGNICMDYCMVDLTKVRDQVKEGQQVVIFGQQADKIISVEEVASLASTIPYEILTSIASRVNRQYKEDESREEPTR